MAGQELQVNRLRLLAHSGSLLFGYSGNVQDSNAIHLMENQALDDVSCERSRFPGALRQPCEPFGLLCCGFGARDARCGEARSADKGLSQTCANILLAVSGGHVCKRRLL